VTTLAAAVDAVDKLWTIDTMPDAPFLEAGDELVEISARFPEHIYAPTQETIPAKIRVRRAVAGTTAATHAQGITLTPVYPESASSAGSEQTIRLLGPTNITFETPDIGNSAVVLTIPAGATVIKAALFTTTFWEQAASANPDAIVLQLQGDGEVSGHTLVEYNVDNQTIGDATHRIEGGILSEFSPGGGAKCVTENTLRVSITGTLVQGAGFVEALIAEPSA
jgi:hypothetical protein